MQGTAAPGVVSILRPKEQQFPIVPAVLVSAGADGYNAWQLFGARVTAAPAGSHRVG